MSGGTFALSADFVPGTFASNSAVTVEIDSDQNVATGFREGAIGQDLWVIVDPVFSPAVYRYDPVTQTFRIIQTITATRRLNGIDISFPLSAIGKTDASFNFAVGAGVASGDPDGGFTYTDFMPDLSAPITAQAIRSFSAAPAKIVRGQSAVLSWTTSTTGGVTIDNGVGAQPSTGSIAVAPQVTTVYTLTANGSAGTQIAQATVQVINDALLTITRSPAGMTQTAGVGGATDRVVVTNIGGSATSVTATPCCTFFSIAPTSFPLQPRESREITITAFPSALGVYDGRIDFTGGGSSATAKVRLLVAGLPDKPVIVHPVVPRVDVGAAAGQNTEGALAFRNDGTGQLQGIAASDKPWLVPESGAIVIDPGQSRSVSFTIDAAKFADTSTQQTSETATLSLTYLTPPGQGKTAVINAGGGTKTEQTPITYTPRPPVGDGAIPALPGQVAFFLNGMPRSAFVLSDFLAINRQPDKTLSNLGLFFTGASVPASLSRLVSLATVPANSTLAYPDVVKGLFSATASAGTVQVRTDDFEKVAVSAVIRRSGDVRGLFATAMKPYRSDRAAVKNDKIYLVGITPEQGLTANLYLQEASGNSTSARTDYVSATGQVLSSRNDDLSAFGLSEIPLSIPDGNVGLIITNTGSGTLLARALLTESSTGDITDLVEWNRINGVAGSEQQTIPYVTRQHGVSGDTRTQLLITNVSDKTLTGTLQFKNDFQRRRAVRGSSIDEWVSTTGSSAPPNVVNEWSPDRTAVRRWNPAQPEGFIAETNGLQLSPIAPGATTIYDDVLATLGVGDTNHGTLVFTPTAGRAAITARLKSSTPKIGATTTVLPVVSTGAERSESRAFGGLIDAPPDDAIAHKPNTLRLSFGMVELKGKPVTVRATLFYTATRLGDKTTISGTATRDYSVGAGSTEYFPDLTTELLGAGRSNVGVLTDLRLDFTVLTGDGAVAPYVISTENATRDLIVQTP